MSVDAALSAMYQDALLAHYRSPQNRGELSGATGVGSRRNPLCGDEIRVQVEMHGERIGAIGFTGQSCSITTASASMMTGAVRGLTRPEALALAAGVDAMLIGDASALPATLNPLRGVAPFPARHGCATMPWAALRAALG